MNIPDQSFDPSHIEGYHAHIYYGDQNQRQVAADIRDAIEARFDVVMGRWREKPVGPHPMPMYQVAFDKNVLPEILPWLMSVRGPLSILIHCCTGRSDLLDHTAGALWLGDELILDTAFFGDEIGRKG